MSLRETINAAKREAQEANAPLAKKDEKDAAEPLARRRSR